jgi:hypothetical protein
MSYSEVKEILGEECELIAESGDPRTEYHTAAFMFQRRGSVGANMNYMMQGGKLITKAQMGMR